MLNEPPKVRAVIPSNVVVRCQDESGRYIRIQTYANVGVDYWPDGSLVVTLPHGEQVILYASNPLTEHLA